MIKEIVVDSETGGLSHDTDALLQYAGMIVIDGVEKEEFSFNVKPFQGKALNKTALKVNNLTEEKIAGFRDPRECQADFKAILEKYVDPFDKADKFIFLNWNKDFDFKFLRKYFTDCDDKYFYSYFHGMPIDMRQICMYALRPKFAEMHRDEYKLQGMARRLGLTVDNALLHEALYDVRLSYRATQAALAEIARQQITKTEAVL